MIDKVSKQDCCICRACGEVCPVHAIEFKENYHGFYYPIKKDVLSVKNVRMFVQVYMKVLKCKVVTQLLMWEKVRMMLTAWKVHQEEFFLKL